MQAMSEEGKRLISHSGQASSLVDAFPLQNIHVRNYFLQSSPSELAI
jgi:hypothetical protein